MKRTVVSKRIIRVILTVLMLAGLTVTIPSVMAIAESGIGEADRLGEAAAGENQIKINPETGDSILIYVLFVVFLIFAVIILRVSRKSKNREK